MGKDPVTTAPCWTVGVVGCGRIAGRWDQPRRDGPVTTHAQAYFRHPHFRLVSAVSAAREHLEEFQRGWSVPREYLSLSGMLNDERLDVISLCTPNPLHYAQAVEILSSPHRPRVLFLEKPVCQRQEELAHLLELMQQGGVGVVVNHTRRFDLGHRRVAALMRSGELGRLVGGRCTYYGGWLNNGSHLVDTLRMVCPDEPQIISAVPAGSGRGDDANLHVIVQVGQAQLQLEAVDEASYQVYESDFRLEFGRIQLLDGGREIVVEHVTVNELSERVLVPHEGSPWDGLRSPLATAVEAIDEFLGGRNHLVELGVALDTAAKTMNLLWQAQDLAAQTLHV